MPNSEEYLLSEKPRFLTSVRMLAKWLKTCGEVNLERVGLEELNPGESFIGFGISPGIKSQPCHLFVFQVPEEGIDQELMDNYGRSGRSRGVNLSLEDEKIAFASFDGGCLENRIDGGRGSLVNQIDVYEKSLHLFRCSKEAYQELVDFVLEND